MDRGTGCMHFDIEKLRKAVDLTDQSLDSLTAGTAVPFFSCEMKELR
jgi:hypothetical protein